MTGNAGAPATGPFVVVGIGELLWDLFPDGRRELGGAVANLVYHATQLGDRGVVASRIGRDAAGADLVARLHELGVDCSHLQHDAAHPTGTVDVRLADGHPSYTIHQQVAFDFPELDRRWQELAARTDAVTFGTLAQRTPAAAEAIARFVAACPPACVRLLDVNLRQQFWSAALLERSLGAATAVKLNAVELPAVAAAVGVAGGTAHATLQRLVERYRLRLACLTRGERGSLLVTGGAQDATEHPGTRVAVADTVGAGDAFAAAVLYHLLRGSSLRQMAAAANDYAAFVATRRGGTPALPAPVLGRARRGAAADG
jgi:fructokinase